MNPAIIRKVTNLFGKLGWKIHGGENNDHEEMFGNYCEMLYSLDPEEQELIVSLTERFLYCSYFMYPSTLRTALERVDSRTISESSFVALLPLKAPKDFGKSKSSDSILYTCNHLVISRMPAFTGKRVVSYEKWELLKEKHSKRRNALVLLLDDFVGTGQTAREALEYYEANIRVESDVPIVIAMVAQEVGLEVVRSMGYEIAVAHTR